MLVAFAVTVLLGVAVAVLTAVVPALRIADELRVAALVCVSGAVAAWAVVGTIAGAGDEALDPTDLAAALVGAAVIAVVAWRGRRRMFDELGLSAHTPAPATAEQPHQFV